MYLYIFPIYQNEYQTNKETNKGFHLLYVILPLNKTRHDKIEPCLLKFITLILNLDVIIQEISLVFQQFCCFQQ